MGLLVVCTIAFAFGFVGSVPLAGPIAVMVVSRAARAKFAEALRLGLGAAVAEGLYAGLAFWGFTTLLSRHALVVPVSRAATALVMTPLGLRFMFWRAKERGHRENRAGTALLGFSISALNPTLLLTWSVAAAFLYSGRIERPSELDAIPFGLSATAGVGSWFLVLVGILRKYEGKLREDVLTAAVRLLGLVLFAIGVVSAVRLVSWFLHGRG